MTSLEKMEMNVAGLFWTRQPEMIEELEDLGYTVDEAYDEYVAVTDDREDSSFILYLGHANSTMWVENVKEAF